ncbi:peptidylprolyl isomerase [Thermodesulfobacteriota bacterium]
MQTRQIGCFLLLLTALSLAIIALPATAPAVDNQVSIEKVAMVNGTVIPKEDLDRETTRVYQQLSISGKSLDEPQLKEIQKEILETLISKELLYQESQKNGINVEDDTVNMQMNTLKARFPGEVEYKKALEQMALTETDLKLEITKGLAIQKLIDQEIVQKIEIPDKEIKAFYDGNPGSFKKPEQVKASHILIKVEPEADDEKKAAARKKLEDIRVKIEKGGDFEALAKEYSEGPSSSNGGDLGYFGRGQMVKPFEEAAFALKPGEVSDVVETRFGYHLIKVVEKKPETIISYDETKDKIKQYLVQQKARKQLDLYIEELRGKAKVERFLPGSTG